MIEGGGKQQVLSCRGRERAQDATRDDFDPAEMRRRSDLRCFAGVICGCPLRCAFENPQSVHRMVRGVRKPDEYAAAVARIFRQEPLAAEAVFSA